MRSSTWLASTQCFSCFSRCMSHMRRTVTRLKVCDFCIASFFWLPHSKKLADIAVITTSKNVENLLAKYKTQIGGDFEVCITTTIFSFIVLTPLLPSQNTFQAYRGHIYRVLTYINYFLDGDKSQQNAIEAALVYHDLGPPPHLTFVSTHFSNFRSVVWLSTQLSWGTAHSSDVGRGHDFN